MKQYYLYICALLVLCYACADRKEEIDAFHVVKRIVDYDSIYSDKQDLWGPVLNMEIMGNVLILKHSKDDYFFSFLDIEDKELLCRWGSKGEGPNEYVQTGLSFTVFNSRLVFSDDTKKEINYIPIEDILKGGDSLSVKKEPYPYTVDFRPRDIHVFNPVKIAIGAFKEGRFGILDSLNTITPCLFEYPFHYNEITGIYRGSVFQTIMKSNQKQRKFVLSTLASDIFEIYEISDSGEIDRIFVNSFNHVPPIWKKGDRYTIDYKQSIAGISNVAVSDDFIYLAYSSENYEKNVEFSEGIDEILCFNWNGEKIKKYILPFHINRFCVDNTSIYAAKYDEDEMIFYRFNLGSL